MIIYDKMLEKLKEKDISSYTIRKNKIIGQETYKKIKSGGHIDTRTLNAMCKLLDCQPGDLLEYVPDNESGINDDKM